MAADIQGFMRSWIAGGTAGVAGSDLSISQTINSIVSPTGYQYLFVKVVAGLIVPCTAVTDKAVGVLQNKPAPGQPGTVMVSGVTKVKSSDATITIGSPVYIDAFGFANATPQTKQCVGMAEAVSATATGFMISVLLRPLGAFGV
jgi:Uncharacterized conserved protein (DUF2190)